MYLSICSGIEAATVAWHPLGWTPVGFAEIEPFPSAVLAHHYPNVPNLGDMTKYKEWNIERPEILVGGTPCQAFSVAGLRDGLNDARGNLSLTFCELANHFDPEFVVWENVPGVLSDKTGAFGCLLAGLAGEVEALIPPGGRWKNAGYVSGPKRSVAWRVLDAQYFGVAQRRRRVFVVASAGNVCASEILFERESLRRDSAPSRETREDATRGAAQCFEPRSPDGHARLIGDFSPTLNRMGGGQREPCVMYAPETARCVTTGEAKRQDYETCTMVAQPFRETADCLTSAYETKWNGNASADNGSLFVAQPIPFDTTQITSPQNGCNPQPGAPCHPLAAGAHPPAIAQPITQYGDIAASLTARHDSSPCADRGSNVVAQPICFSEVAQPIRSNGYNNSDPGMEAKMHIMQAMQVRRLTPIECERLQGFPDNYTNIPWRKKPESPDGPRYKALGNSMAVPVMRWIGERIDECRKNTSKR